MLQKTRRGKKTLWEFLGVAPPPGWGFAPATKLPKPGRKLKSFTEVTGPVHRRARRHIKVDPKSGSSSFAIPIPKHLPDLQKWNRIFEMCETVEAMKEDDVILLGMSVPPTVG